MPGKHHRHSSPLNIVEAIMKTILFACLVALAAARPDSYEVSGSRRFDTSDEVPILRDDRVHPEDGAYSFDVETGDGIVRSESGSPLTHIEDEPVGQQGTIQFPLPNGEIFELKFVANENGYQPESSFLPVAPAFPHPIPQFVLDQIAKAELEDREGVRSSAPSNRYSYDDDDDRK